MYLGAIYFGETMYSTINDTLCYYGKPIDVYMAMTKKRRKKTRNKYNKRQKAKMQTVIYPEIETISLDTFECVTIDMEAYGAPIFRLSNQNQEKENTMCYDRPVSEASVSQEKTAYLQRRLNEIKWEKQREVSTAFGMNGFNFKTKDELLKALKRIEVVEDAFTKEGTLRYDYFGWMDAIRLVPENYDEEGFKTASEQLEKDYQMTKDEIQVVAPEMALQSLRAFEEKTYQ